MTEAKCDYCGNHTECSSASFGRWICPVCKANGLDEVYDEGAEVDEAEREGVTGSSFLWKNVEVDLEPDETQVTDVDLDWAPDESEINTDLPEPEWDEETETLAIQRLREKLTHNRTAPARQTQIGGDHYRSLGIQPWDAMEMWLTQAEFRGFLRGNAIKYLARAGKKGSAKDDFAKAEHYIKRLLETFE